MLAILFNLCAIMVLWHFGAGGWALLVIPVALVNFLAGLTKPERRR